MTPKERALLNIECALDGATGNDADAILKKYAFELESYIQNGWHTSHDEYAEWCETLSVINERIRMMRK